MEKSEFLTFLVDETLKLHDRGESKLTSLEQKLTDYNLNFLKGEFIPQLQMLRFKTQFGMVDVPINWSLFECDGYTLLDQENDKDFFFSVLKSAWTIPMERLLVLHADGFSYLVAFKMGEEAHLHDIVNPQEWLKSA